MEKNLSFTFFIQYFEHKLVYHSKVINQDLINCIIFILNGIRKQYGEGQLKLLTIKNEQLNVDQIIEKNILNVFIELPGRIDIETEKKIEEKRMRTFYTVNEKSILSIEKIKQVKNSDGNISIATLAKTEMNLSEINLLNTNFAADDKIKNQGQFINLYSFGAQPSTIKKGKAQYTLKEVAKHNSQDDAWMIINNEVYDITQYAKIHPGGKQILIKYAGQDGTQLFRFRLVKFHPHVNAVRILEKYYIGSLKK